MVNVNGKPLEIAGKTLAGYLESTAYDMKRIATELNGNIVPKASYAHTVLRDGDSVEIVSFVGGG
ncbi:MAG: sulfur carrier protein ThiS [Ruminococcaceae bacterium]|nr:sulfur carrier protein ThiS [Oscillospiraceae bacterium]